MHISWTNKGIDTINMHGATMRQLNTIYFIELHIAAYNRLHSRPQLAFKYILRNVSTDFNTYIYIYIHTHTHTHIKGKVTSIYVFCFLPDNGRMDRRKLVVGKSVNESTVFRRWVYVNLSRYWLTWATGWYYINKHGGICFKDQLWT